MANVLVEENSLSAIAEAIRGVNQKTFNVTASAADITMGQIACISGSYVYGTKLTDNNIHDLIAGIDTISTFYSTASTITSLGLAFSPFEKIYLPNCTSLSMSAFYSCSNLTYISLPNLVNLASSAFAYCSNLSLINLPKISTTIPSYTFTGCINLSKINSPVLTSLGTQAFYQCSKLNNLNQLDSVTSAASPFMYCSNLTSLNLPALKNYISLSQVYSLVQVNIPQLPYVTGYGFYQCYALSEANFPQASYVGVYAFDYCYNLISVSLPLVTSISTSAFANCHLLPSISLPKCYSIGASAFRLCSNLSLVSLSANYSTSASWNINTGAFSECYVLSKLYLRGSYLYNLTNSNAFTSTPIGNYHNYMLDTGSIYVPSSLLTSYKAATNWTYFSAKIVSG